MVYIHSPENITYGKRDILINVSTSEQVDKLLYSLNGGENIPFDGYTTVAAVEGVNSIVVTAIDRAGNIGTSRVFFSVDTTYPVIHFVSPVNLAYYNSTTVPVIVISDKPVDTWLYSIDGGANNTFNLYNSTNANITLNLSEGVHNIVVYANDSSTGIWVSKSVNFTVDTTPPALSFVYPTPADGATTDKKQFNITVNITSSEKLSGAILNIKSYYLNGTFIEELNKTMKGQGTNWFETVPFVGIEDREVHYKVYGRDIAGNINTSEERIYNINTPPFINIISPANTSYSRRFVDLFIDTFDSSGISQVWFSIDAQPNKTITDLWNHSKFLRLYGLSTGVHKVAVYANDTYGNVNSDTVIFTILPVFDVKAYADSKIKYVEEGENATYTITIKNTGNANDTYAIKAFTGAKYMYLPDTEVSIEPGKEKNITLTLSSGVGSYYTTVFIASKNNTKKYEILYLRTIVTPAFWAYIYPGELSVKSGDNATYYIEIENGKQPKNITIGIKSPLNYTISNTTISLSGNGSQTIPLNLTSSKEGVYITLLNFTSGVIVKKSFIKTIVTTKKLYGVALEAEPESREVNTGKNATYEIKIRNTGNVNDTYRLIVISGFVDSAVLSSKSISLGAGEEGKVNLTVTSASGGIYKVSVVAISKGDPSKFAKVTTKTTVKEASAYVMVYPWMQRIYPGENATYKILIKNTGTVDDSYNITFRNYSSVNVTLSPERVFLKAGDWIEAEMKVNSEIEGEHNITVFVNSDNSWNLTHGINITTVVEKKPFYGVALKIDDNVRKITPGENATYPVEITNTGNQNDTIRLYTKSTAGFTDFIGSIDLSPGESVKRNLIVSDNRQGSYITIIRAISLGNSSAGAKIYTITHVVNPVKLKIKPGSRSVNLGEVAEFEITIENNGDVEREINITTSNGTLAKPEVDSVTVPSGKSKEVKMKVNATATGYYEIKVRAFDSSKPDINDSSVIRVIVLNKSVHGVRLEPDKKEEIVKIGNNATFILKVINLGNVNDTFNITVKADSAINYSLNPDNTTLQPLSSSTSVLTISAPEGEYDILVKAFQTEGKGVPSVRKLKLRVINTSNVSCVSITGLVTIESSKVICPTYISDSSIKKSLVVSSNISESTVEKSEIINSYLYKSSISGSRINNSEIYNSIVIDSRVRHAYIKDTVVKDMTVGSKLNGSVIEYGNITLHGVWFNISHPVNISDIVKAYSEEDQTLAGMENQTLKLKMADTELIIPVNESFVGASLKVVRSAIPPHIAPNTTGNYTIFEYATIEASEAIVNNSGTMELRIYYDSLPSDNYTFNISYYNESTGKWEILNSWVNKNEKYVAANITHFSVYGVAGQILPVSTTSSSSSTTSSAPGGGGGGAAPTGYEVTVAQVEKGKFTQIKLDPEKAADLYEVEIKPRMKLYNAKLKVEELEKLPSYVKAIGKEPYKYIKITLSSSAVEEVKLRFRVNVSWLKDKDINPATVRLLRYTTGNWQELETEQIKAEDGKYLLYEAISPGFSYFAIAGEANSGFSSEEPKVVEVVEKKTEVEIPEIPSLPEKKEEEVKKPEEKQEIEKKEIEKPVTEEAKQYKQEKKFFGLCGPSVVALIASLSLILRRRRN